MRSTRLNFQLHVSVNEREHSAWLLLFSLGPTVVGGSILKEKEIGKDSTWEELDGERSF